MLFFFITCCFSFIFFYKSLAIKPLPSWTCGMRLLSFWFLKDFPGFPITQSVRNTVLPKKKSCSSGVVNVHGTSEISMLDLPDLVLESILEKLPPEGLCKVAGVCTSLRDRCMSDHMWEKHLKNKWAKVVGLNAYKKWQSQIASRKDNTFFNQNSLSSLMDFFIHLWPLLLIRSSFSSCSSKKKNFPPVGSIMSLYFSLDSGKFWFPAQVYNRENGHVGFMLSCYDAELSYDQGTDTFLARYPPHGRRASATETGITWDRVRTSPVNISAHDLHVSYCLKELQPGDHIEIEWRKSKDFPYGKWMILWLGWWYGVVGHLETCDGSAISCRCCDSGELMPVFPKGCYEFPFLIIEFEHPMKANIRWKLSYIKDTPSISIGMILGLSSHAFVIGFYPNGDTVMLEFNHYSRDSRWRRKAINRKDHREDGNEGDGFYGRIRQMMRDEEISAWQHLWPSQLLE